MTLSQAVIAGVLAIFAGAGGSLIQGWLNKPKTAAEAGNLHVAAEVSVSAESREWARDFAQRAKAAEDRAVLAEQRAEKAEERVDVLEAGLIECYGYVRLLRDHYRQHGETAPALPVRLEALWRNGDD
jgi:folate-dependent phosphoribosylglycinamide formyltransferase PurN